MANIKDKNQLRQILENAKVKLFFNPNGSYIKEQYNLFIIIADYKNYQACKDLQKLYNNISITYK